MWMPIASDPLLSRGIGVIYREWQSNQPVIDYSSLSDVSFMLKSRGSTMHVLVHVEIVLE